MPKSTYAICGAILFAAFGLCVSFNGTSHVSDALLFGGLSQFAAQDDWKYSWISARALSYIAIGFALFAAWGV
ncbi:hypothetical protein V19_13 [Brucella phage V_19]|uniref:Uncharacterized protein n=28 Tax=Perisivirus TaxID=1984798 RepID=H2EI50_9CAUD|nr:hypothetical protein F354_gp13 [Brucella phage Tb]YP_007002079.1 hypothetical protein F355_gp13 [Brucella phage Pr]AHB81073.1 hypothetical protein Bk_13 [Brucella phage Bk]AHB81129.1 hypothetical protein Fz_143 [Brucella phage Fz]AHB81187.1 hypothetical protein R/C_13 [Brucella phage R/C]AHB81243.1 hypothetical protein S708_13 [Brucella phage S708]AHB81357.1 hypothetical protein Wb_13 [Brucella phage Wb]AKO59001.1 hypothetical protein p0219_13 [Brucella phage 02_19]AKO59059.1 hypothetica